MYLIKILSKDKMAKKTIIGYYGSGAIIEEAKSKAVEFRSKQLAEIVSISLERNQHPELNITKTEIVEVY